MSTTRLWTVWAVISMVWAALYVAMYAYSGDHLEFNKVVSDVLSPIVMFLIFGGMGVNIFRAFRGSRSQ